MNAVEQIAVVGLGKLGLALAACLVEAGYNVVGVDVEPALVDAVNRGKAASAEPGVRERLLNGSGSLRATMDGRAAVLETDCSFLVLPTPSNGLGGFSLRYILSGCDAIGTALREHRGRHVVSVVSTMLPGSSQRLVIPRIETASGRRAGEDWGYCYNPAFVALGEVVEGFLRPDSILIGESDPESGDRILEVHRRMVATQPPVVRVTPSEAEIIKLASNTHETMRVAFANMLLALCTEFPGTDVDHVTGALSHRIGKRFFRGAAPYGGPCWPRDNVALSLLLDELRVPSIVPRAVHESNAAHGRYIFRKLLEMTRPDDTVGLLGLAYKPGTPVVEEAFGTQLAGWLADEGRRVVGWDPLAMPSAGQVLGSAITFATSAIDCVQRSDVVVIVNPLPELSLVPWSELGSRIIVDCWRCLSPSIAKCLPGYYPLGRTAASDPEGPAVLLSTEQLRLLTG